MTRETIAQRIMQCTPRELQRALDVIHSWKDGYNDKSAERVETVQEIIDFLSSPEYIKEAEDFKNFTGEDYLRAMFNI